MKILKWVAVTVLIVCILGLSWLMRAWFIGERRGDIPDQPVPESILESVENLPLRNIKLSDDLIYAELLETTYIDGILCASEWVGLTSSGQLSQCTLAEDTVIDGNLIPKNTEIDLDDELKLKYAYFLEDTEIQGYLLHNRYGRRPGGALTISAWFYPDGRLQGFYSRSNVMVQEIPCRKIYNGLFAHTPIQLHENGNLRNCTLSRDAEIDGQIIPPGITVTLSEDGKISKLDYSMKVVIELLAAGTFGY